MSATPDSPLANPEQRIADLERQLAASNTERDEAQAREAALAEVLQVINSFPGDLTRVFDALLEKATTLCRSGFGLVFDHSSEPPRVAASRGISIPTGEATAAVPPTPGGAYETMRAGAPFVHIADLKDSDAYRNGDPARGTLVDGLCARAAVWVALRKDAVLLGSLMIYRQEPRPFTDEQIALLRTSQRKP